MLPYRQTVRMAPLDSGINCAARLCKAVEVAQCRIFVGMGKARIWQRNRLMNLLCCPLPPRNRRRQPGCAMCLIPDQASGASALAVAFVTVVLMGGPYATPQCCVVLR